MIHPALWLIGYYEIGVLPVEVPKFIELCAALDIDFCDEGESAATGRRRFLVSARLFRRLVRECASARIDASVEEKRGAPLSLLRILRRPGLVLGLIVFTTLAALSGRVIWRIEVVGNDTLEYSEVCDMLDRCGVRVGAVSSALDVDKISNRILANTDKVSWLSINIVGTVATVEIREALPPPAPEPPVCSNVIAAENGIIVDLDNVRGNLCVGIGDAVSKGDLLVGGVYGGENEATRFVRATGSVFALVNREIEVDIPLEYSKKIYTGRQKTQKTLIFFEKEVKFFGNSGNSYATCDTIEAVEYFNFFGLGELPIGIRTVTHVEYERARCVFGEDEARAEAKRELWRRFEEISGGGAQLAASDIDITFDEGRCRLYARIESVEDIAREQSVEINITD